jgi:ribonucleoside-diphosphate reductase alpha chain
MSSYDNFRNNDLYTDNNTDIYNPSFASNVKTNELKMTTFEKNLDKWIYFCQWSKWYPDLFFDLISPEKGGMRLDLDQRVFLRAMCRFMSTYGVMPRGYGKTLIELMSIYHTCIFYPDITISMSAQTKENASSISEDKHRELMKFYPLLQNEITNSSFTKNGAEVEFANGSIYNVLANAQSSKGQRRRRMIIEESALLNNDLFKDCLEPVVNVPRRTVGRRSEVNPWELNGMINFVTTSGYRGSDEYIRVLGMLDSMAELKGKFVLGASWKLPCYYGRGETEAQIMAKKNDPTQSAVRFSQNYESKWVGSADGALINISKMLKLQTLSKPELSCPKDKKGNFELCEYVFGVDVARSNAQSNNKSCVVVLKIIRNTKEEIRQIQLVNIVEPPNGYTFKEQSVVVKRLFYKYGGNLDLHKSRVKAIVVDGNVIGKGLIDRLCEEVTDPDTNEELGCFASINSDIHCDNPNAPKLIYDLTAQGINGDIITKFTDYIETERLKLIKNFDEIKSSFSNEEERMESEFACLNTKFLIDEVANLKLVKTKTSITVEQTVKKVDKDRYSALAYALYYISLFMERYIEPNKTDWSKAPTFVSSINFNTI